MGISLRVGLRGLLKRNRASPCDVRCDERALRFQIRSTPPRNWHTSAKTVPSFPSHFPRRSGSCCSPAAVPPRKSGFALYSSTSSFFIVGQVGRDGIKQVFTMLTRPGTQALYCRHTLLSACSLAVPFTDVVEGDYVKDDACSTALLRILANLKSPRIESSLGHTKSVLSLFTHSSR